MSSLECNLFVLFLTTESDNRLINLQIIILETPLQQPLDIITGELVLVQRVLNISKKYNTSFKFYHVFAHLPLLFPISNLNYSAKKMIQKYQQLQSRPTLSMSRVMSQSKIKERKV